MSRFTLAVLSALFWLVAASPAAAHTLWLNLYESYSHPPGHAMVSIGWGHNLPMDDIIQGITLESYSLVDPDAKATAMTLPASPEKTPPTTTPSGMSLQQGDVGVNKITLSDKSKPGTYQVAVVSKDNYFTIFLDKEGKKRWVAKSKDQVQDAKQILGSMFYKSFAKAYFKVGDWKAPKALGHDLEIMPVGDLCNVRAGDKVDFKVLFMGKPLNTRPDQGIEYITASSNTFGGPDHFMLSAMIFNGKGGFRFPTAGQWVVNVYHRQDVSKNSDLKHLAAKCATVMHAASISFNVKP